MAEMTKMQQKIYDYIVQMLTEEGFAPSVREIGAAVGLKSPSTVHFHLKNMEERGIIKRSGRKGRTITLVRPAKAAAPVQVQEVEPPVGRVPIVGSVAADPGPGVHRGLSGLRHRRQGRRVLCSACAG